MRGRVISYYAMAFFWHAGRSAGLAVGAIAHTMGAPFTILCQGIATLLIASYFLSIPQERYSVKETENETAQVEETIVEST